MNPMQWADERVANAVQNPRPDCIFCGRPCRVRYDTEAGTMLPEPGALKLDFVDPRGSDVLPLFCHGSCLDGQDTFHVEQAIRRSIQSFAIRTPPA